jgi:hypothetical protein
MEDSALYVVDLVKFRKSAAGDNLRVYYESLSKDPNSLSNLDQDLPNYAQHTVPIFSLPQQWLWCESWCGNATKAYAKTIDLCNNPMTKEPKLEVGLSLNILTYLMKCQFLLIVYSVTISHMLKACCTHLIYIYMKGF